MNSPFLMDPQVVRVMLYAAMDVWESKYKERYTALSSHARRLGLEISSEDDYIKVLTTTPTKIFDIMFDELETFVFVHALQEQMTPNKYPKAPASS